MIVSCSKFLLFFDKTEIPDVGKLFVLLVFNCSFNSKSNTVLGA